MAVTGQVLGQNLYVIAARGNIKSQIKGKNLRSGDVIPANDELIFTDETDKLSVISEEGVRYIARYPRKRFRKRKNQFPFQEIKTLGTVGQFPVDPPITNVEETKKFFSDSSFVFLGPDTRLKVHKKLFPMSRALFFYINYDYKEDNIDKKIDYKADTLILIKRNLFKIDGKEVDGKFAENYSLYYYSQPKNKHTFLGKMKPFFPVDERLKEETDVLTTRLRQKGATNDVVIKELAGFINQHYGTVISNDFSQWIVETYPVLTSDALRAYADAKAKTDASLATLTAAKPIEAAQKEDIKNKKGAKK